RLKTSTTSTPKHNGSSGVATQERCWKHWSNTHSNGAALANDARSEHPPRDQNDVSYDESAQSAARAPQPAVGLTPTAHGATWARSWVAAQQRVEPDNAPPAPGLSHNTLRQILRLSVAGERLRVELSNEFGNSSLRLHRVFVARFAGDGSRVVPGTTRELTFAGRTNLTIAAGARVL